MPVFPVFCHKWSQNLALGRYTNWRSKAAQKAQRRVTCWEPHWRSEPLTTGRDQSLGREQAKFRFHFSVQTQMKEILSPLGVRFWLHDIEAWEVLFLSLQVWWWHLGDMSQWECGTCQLHNAETGTDAAGVSVQDAGSHCSPLTINWGSALTEESSRMWGSCVVWKKRWFSLKGRLQCSKVNATVRGGNAFPHTYLLRAHSIFYFTDPTKASVRTCWDDSFKRSCDAVLAPTAEFWLFTNSRKSHWRSFLIK